MTRRLSEFGREMGPVVGQNGIGYPVWEYPIVQRHGGEERCACLAHRYASSEFGVPVRDHRYELVPVLSGWEWSEEVYGYFV